MVMKLKVYGQEIPCQKAEKGADFVRAYDENGRCVFEASGVQSFEGYLLSGGAWSEAEPSDAQRIEELETLVAQLLFGGENA